MIFDHDTKELIRSLIGDYAVLKDHRGDNGRTGVMEVSSGGERYFVKIHNRLSHWHPEVFAYRHWTKGIEPLAPTMRASFNTGEVFGIITTPIVGRTVNEAKIAGESKLATIYRDAGALFRRMQQGTANAYFGIPRDDGTPFEKADAATPEAYVANAIEALFRRGFDAALFSGAHRSLTEWCLKNCAIFAEDIPTFTNWDFSQNNWMVDENGDFTGFIDFENALWGLPLDSFGVILERYTFDRPALRDAFFDGYGLSDDDVTRMKLRILSLKMALADVYNGHAHEHPRFLECGMRMLEHLVGNQCL